MVVVRPSCAASMKRSAALRWPFMTGAAGWIGRWKCLLQGAQIRPQGRIQVRAHVSPERFQTLASFKASVHRGYPCHGANAQNFARHKTRRGSRRSRPRHRPKKQLLRIWHNPWCGDLDEYRRARAALGKHREGQTVGDNAFDVIVCPRFAALIGDARIEGIELAFRARRKDDGVRLHQPSDFAGRAR